MQKTTKHETVETGEAATVTATPLESVDQLLNRILSGEEEHRKVAIDLIDFNPNNRRYVRPAAIEELAQSIRQVGGIIQDVLLRNMPGGRFEIVAGERRVSAAKLVGLTEVPTKICNLTDQQARQLRYTENAQRSDLHPIDEAFVLLEIFQDFPSIPEVAARVGKSESFVYNRMKLCDLSSDLQEIVLADKFSIREAAALAGLAAESQDHFFQTYCKSWKEGEDFKVWDISSKIANYKYDLINPPFDPQNADLVPSVGACTGCQFNTAYQNTLFPSEAIRPACQKITCFQNKVQVNFLNEFTRLFKEHNPTALLFDGKPSEEMLERLAIIPESLTLPRHNRYYVGKIPHPQMPERPELTPEELKKKGAKKRAEQAYQAEVDHYNRRCVDLKDNLASGRYICALDITESQCELVYTTKPNERPSEVQTVSHTSKQVHDAIRKGDATGEMIQGEINRINIRSENDAQGERAKVQREIFEGMAALTKKEGRSVKYTLQDKVCLRLILYNSLSETAKQFAQKQYFPRCGAGTSEKLLASLSKLTPLQESFLVRLSLLGDVESSKEGTPEGLMLYQVARAAGFDSRPIEKKNAELAGVRIKRVKDRIAHLTGELKNFQARQKQKGAKTTQ